ncbi:MAG: glycosyltransferase [bacterium]
MSAPSISVIVPSYNQGLFLDRCLNSIASQEYDGRVEIIVVDDGSSDDSRSIARCHPTKPLVIEQANAGVSGARNAGAARATGDILAFLDADDRWLPGKLAAQAALHQAPTLSFTRYRRVSPEGLSVPNAALHPSLSLVATRENLLRQNFIGTSTVMVDRQCFDGCGGFPQTHDLLKSGQDYALWLRIVGRFGCCYLPEVFTEYTVHTQNRVGVDPLKHLVGGLNALRSLSEWSPELFDAMSGGRSLAHLERARKARLLKDLILKRKNFPRGSFVRFLDYVQTGDIPD